MQIVSNSVIRENVAMDNKINELETQQSLRYVTKRSDPYVDLLRSVL